MSEDANKGESPVPQTVKDAAAKATPPVPTVEEVVAERLKAERTKWEADQSAKQKKAEEAAAKKKAEEEGQYKELAATAEKKAADAEAERDALKRERAVEKALLKAAGEHAEYPFDVFEKYVMPALLREASGDDFDAEKSAKQAVADYVKDNPREKKGSGGAPAPLPRTGNRIAGLPNPAPQNNERPARRFSTLTRRP